MSTLDERADQMKDLGLKFNGETHEYRGNGLYSDLFVSSHAILNLSDNAWDEMIKDMKRAVERLSR